MKTVPRSVQEEARLDALLGFKILDTATEPVFDRLVSLAALITETPMAVMSLVDRDRLWFKARIGVPQSEEPRLGSFCTTTIRNFPLFVVPDALSDARFRDMPLVKGGVRFYAGAPFIVAERHPIGCIGVFDVKPRQLNPGQRDALVILARAAAAHLESRREATLRKRRDKIMISLLGDLKEGGQKLHEGNAALERRVSERTAQIQGALKELEGFAFNIAHNLRAPLRAMNGYSQSLLRDHASGLSPEGRKQLDLIAASSRSLDDMISDLLAYYQLPIGTYACGPVDLGLVVERVLAEMDKTIREHRAEVRVQRDLPSVLGNEALLRQVLENLLSNALKFTAPGARPVIDLGAEPRGPWVRLWVGDKGIGIAPHHQERVFQVFERLNRAENYPGNGIGLSIVRKAVELMGGRAGIESAFGQGSRFWVDLKAVLR